ncbi:MAG: hypothetical protein U9N42_03695 [Campylobacterota bacterium]|nr:hypothetical protein [Campylobacterota bacterium]
MNQFFELFNFAPGLKVLEVTSHSDSFSHQLYEFLSSNEAELVINRYGENHEDVKAKYVDIPTLNAPFRAFAREYKYIILRDILDIHKNPKKLIDFTYHSLENAAFIIVVQSKKSELHVEEIKQMLDDAEFRATNDIDILEDYHVVMAKKLHMWGNGL